MASAMKASQIDLSKVTFSTPKTLDNGGKMLFLNYNGGINPLYITLPEVEVPFDPMYFDDNENSGKYTVKISMKDLETNKELEALHSKISEMDELLKNKAAENSGTWFKKPKLSMDVINELYTPMIKVSTDPETGEPNGKWPDSFGFKIVKKDGVFPRFSIYDNNKVVFDVDRKTDNPVDLENVLMKGTLIKAVLKCNGVWIANGKFGCTWRAEQVRAKVPEGGLREFAIESDSDEEDEVIDEKPVMIEDSDEEEEEEEVKEPEPEPEPKKKVRKLKVKKKSSDGE